MTIRIKHKAASKGVAIGRTHILSTAGAAFPKYWIADKEITSEIARFKRAIQKSKQQLTKVREKLCRFEGKEQIQIIDSHAMLLQDEMIVTHAIQNIANQKINSEWALDKAISRLKLAFSDVKDEYFKQRRNDIDFIGQRIIKNLIGGPELSLHAIKHEDIILIANDFSPADIVNFPRERVKGFISVLGGETSHSAIIARSLGIPAMVGVENILKNIKEGDLIVLDALKDCIIVNPPKTDLSAYKKRRAAFEATAHDLLKDAHLPAETLDTRKVSLVANIEMIEEISSVLQHGAEGIGLFRTEYLYANRMDYPSEDEQFECYKAALEQMSPHPVTIRTLDLGGDKLFVSTEYLEHVNPALGLRAIRFCLAERDLFRTQIRALLRAGLYGNLRILIPMVSSVEEIRLVKSIIEEEKASLKKAREGFEANVQLGIMVEVPSAAIIADVLAKEVGFFSLGTNDLVQYTIAVDRGNEHVAYLYNPLHPAVIRAMKQTVDAAKKAGIDVTVCGEMAGEPLYLLLLVGMGVDALSMNPVSIPRVKKILRTVTAKQAEALYNSVIKLSTAQEIENFVRHEMAGYLKPAKV